MLTVRDHMILTLEEDMPGRSGVKDDRMWVELGLRPARFHQRLLWLVRQPDAVAAFPATCARVQRGVARGTALRAAKRLS